MEPLPREEPTLLTTLRAPEDQVDRKVMIDMHPEIIRYLSSAHPITTITGAVRKTRVATQYRYDWMEKDEMPDVVTATTAKTATDATLTFAGQCAKVSKHSVLMNTATREHVLVTASPSSPWNDVSVARGIGSTKVKVDVGQKFIVLKAIFPDAANMGDLRSIKEYLQYNYTEIHKTGFGFSGRDLNTRMYGGNDQFNEIQWQGIEHAKKIEKSWLFGTRHTRTGDTGKLQTFSGGLEYFVKTHVWDVNGIAPSERSFVEWLEFSMVEGHGGNREGTGTKYFMAGRRWITEMEFWARDRLEYVPSLTKIGMRATRFQTTHGDLILIPHPMLVGEHAGWAFMLDLNHLRYVYHQGRNTKLLRAQEENDLDGAKMQYMTDCGFMIEWQAAHGIVKGLPIH